MRNELIQLENDNDKLTRQMEDKEREIKNLEMEYQRLKEESEESDKIYQREF